MHLPLLTLDSFPTIPVAIKEPTTILFLTFERCELTTAGSPFLTLNNIPLHKRQLFELFLIFTHNSGGQIYSLTLEPALISNQHAKLTPFLRFELSTGIMFLFLLPNKPLGGLEQTMPISTDCSIDDFVARVLDNTQDTNIKLRLATWTKKLICYKLGLVSFNRLFIKGADDTDMTNLFQHVLWFNNRAAPDIPLTLIKEYNGAIIAADTHSSANITQKWTFLMDGFSVNALNKICNKYFLNNTQDEITEHEMSHVDEFDDAAKCIIACLWQFHVFHITTCPTIAKFLQHHSSSAVGHFLKQLSQRTIDRLPFSTAVLGFKYTLTDLFTHKNPCLYNSLILHSYPPLQLTTPCLDTWIKELIKLDQKTFIQQAENNDKFRLIYPHLANIKDVLGDTSATQSAKYTLLVRMLLTDDNKHQTARQFYSALSKRLSLADFNPIKAFQITPTIHNTKTLKGHYKEIIQQLFINHFGITRLRQAITTFHYIIANTSLRWRTGKLMIINCTPPGEGKTFVNDLLRILFSDVDLVHVIGGMTPTSLRYIEEPQIMKTIIMDDMGFSNEVLRNAKNENSTIAGTFKNILDTSMIVSMATERRDTKRETNLFSRKYVAVHNTGFVWNSNSYNIYTTALLDRAIVFDSTNQTQTFDNVAKMAFFSASDTTVNQICKSLGLIDITSCCLFRTHLFQTCVGLLHPQAISIKPQHDIMLTAAQVLYHQRYAITSEELNNKAPSKARITTAIYDLAFQRASFLACTFIFDLWIPPWTQKITDNLTENRLKAFSKIGWQELIAECITIYQLLFPECIIESLPLVLGQEVATSMRLVKDILTASLKIDSFEYSRQDLAQIYIIIDDKLPLCGHSLINEASKRTLNPLTTIHIPVYESHTHPHGKDQLIRELKSTSSLSSKIFSHRLTFSAESLLSLFSVFWPEEIETLWKTISHMAANNNKLITPNFTMYLQNLTTIQKHTLLIASMCPRLSIDFNEETNELSAGRNAGFRMYYICTSNQDFPQDIIGNDAPTQGELNLLGIDEPFQVRPLKWTFKLTKLYNSNVAESLFAHEFSHFCKELFLTTDLTPIITQTPSNRYQMPSIILPTLQNTPLLNLTTEPTSDGNALRLKPGWEYIIAANEWLRIIQNNLNPSDDDIQITTQMLKKRYDLFTEPTQLTPIDSYGYNPDCFSTMKYWFNNTISEQPHSTSTKKRNADCNTNELREKVKKLFESQFFNDN